MKKVVAAALMLCATSVVAQPDMDKYNKSCSVCHTTGAANAPKTHDVEAWAPRMEKGMDALVASVTSGLNAMPPRGMCFDCTPEDYQALITFMSSPAE
ncbi:cytochrome c5 family protein [Mangrovimicrobium sediminis]|uniref:Cytochrome c5 family protein n=1 Tax=Mangrovimicrobium sediminis TaxID=2562682 RepID=A0A4Z0LSD7_9GAMM|nr:c-type cytochrome [Haliea sp. SAOS-164]TGD70201.1 cytochrome c5 family protein [Haliea sp. SAOS-164]